MDWISPVRFESFSGPDGLKSLAALLERQAKMTTLVRVEKPEQVLINPESGRTVNGLGYNREGFGQLCRLVAGGLFTVLLRVWDESAIALPSRQMSICRAFNSLVAAKWPAIKGHRLVVDGGTKTIVGIVGRKYQFVSNYAIMQQVDRQVRVSKAGYRFARGFLRNRDLSVTLVQQSGDVSVGKLQLKQGLSAINSETTQRAIYFPRVIWDSVTRSYSMQGESDRNRLTHRKRKQFVQLLSELVDNAFATEVPRPQLQSVYGRLLAEPLSTRSPELYSEIAKELVDSHVSADTASQIAKSVVTSNENPRTRWILYAAVLAEAERNVRFERYLRQYAFRLLSGGKVP